MAGTGGKRWCGGANRCLLAASLLVMVTIALSACGTRSPGAPASAAPEPTASVSPALSDEVAHLDRLEVTRTDAFPQNHFRFAFPAAVAVTDPLAVQAVARALIDLPKMPSGPMYCPADFGIVYHLVFFSGSQRLLAVSVDATGCETVRGLGATRWVAGSPAFWRVLGTALHLAKPDWTTFRGSQPGG